MRQVQVTFDCAGPARLARSWCEVLGYVVPPRPPGAPREEADRALPPEQQGAAAAIVDPGVDESCLVVQDVEGNESCLD